MFGKDRGGNEELLVELSQHYNFSVTPISAFQDNSVVVSSTKIRTAIEQGEVLLASSMLGRNYSVSGRVVRGDGRGRTLGFPTANIVPTDGNKLMPGNGVYAVTSVIDGKIIGGMANIGIRPTFTTSGEQTLEVHFFDIDKDLYESTLEIVFHEYIRPEQKFSSKDEFLKTIRNRSTNNTIIIIKSEFLVISKERKAEIINQFGGNPENTGKPEVQIALLTETHHRIGRLIAKQTKKITTLAEA